MKIMNELLRCLTGGDLRSDGAAIEVAGIVLDNPDLISDLLDGLNEPNDVVRARTADALEKVSREKPESVLQQLPTLVRLTKRDPVPMVRWHAAMILTNLLVLGQNVDQIAAALMAQLSDKNTFVKSWAISGLCILGRKHPKKRQRILTRLSHLSGDASIAVRHRVVKALSLLTHDQMPLPKGWVKSRHVREV